MTLVDSNVLLDLLTEDPKWGDWSSTAIEIVSADGPLMINDIVYAELSVGFPQIEMLDRFLADAGLEIAPIPRPALFLAAKTHARYRRSGGTRTSVLPDFFIGAQAAVMNLPVLTRDASRFRTYFPTLEIISPQVN